MICGDIKIQLDMLYGWLMLLFDPLLFVFSPSEAKEKAGLRQ